MLYSVYNVSELPTMCVDEIVEAESEGMIDGPNMEGKADCTLNMTGILPNSLIELTLTSVKLHNKCKKMGHGDYNYIKFVGTAEAVCRNNHILHHDVADGFALIRFFSSKVMGDHEFILKYKGKCCALKC